MNKFTKILLVFVLALSLVLVFAACGDNEEEGSLLNGDTNVTTAANGEGGGEDGGTTANGGRIPVVEDPYTHFGVVHTAP
ncbi:MAG: hypothetical protein IJ038_00180 [Clostridia bacterium]|nr:hypothetical protein [Clostridia bacterium]